MLFAAVVNNVARTILRGEHSFYANLFDCIAKGSAALHFVDECVDRLERLAMRQIAIAALCFCFAGEITNIVFRTICIKFQWKLEHSLPLVMLLLLKIHIKFLSIPIKSKIRLSRKFAGMMCGCDECDNPIYFVTCLSDLRIRSKLHGHQRVFFV